MTSESTQGIVTAGQDDLQAIERIADARNRILKEVRKAIYGQQDVIDHLLIALFARGHCLLMGVPGLAKTLLISTLAQILDLSFNRIQFTPDLMPSDITGTDILEEDHATGKRFFKFIKGPIFSNLLLADEINRTPPKTQAALLQSMQEYKVSAGGTTYPLDLPFMVFATQNPIEQEGTYPLPEAQLDRFMFFVTVDYPESDDEFNIVKNTTRSRDVNFERVLTPAEIVELQQMVLRVPISDDVIRYAVKLVRATRPGKAESPDFIREYLAWGAGPRASQYLVVGAKARAILQGRHHADKEDIKALAQSVLRHRMVTNFHAEAQKITSDQLIQRLVETVS